ncbi:porin [Vibrio sp. dsl-7]|uniref:Porin n=1 Tax=Vibrio chanodichtyis TaxID=3027932 RepID=A0ABT5UYT1_9VIBR|nr:porin [Vibrio chanodichtyis]MDE1513613.1 porin [Vibrio chanodichtyis]
MKKTLLAVAVATLSTQAFAEAPKAISADQFKVSGQLGLGGYYDSYTNSVYDDWATAATVKVHYKNGYIVGYLEADLEMNFDTNESKVSPYEGAIQNGPATDIDKAWIGIDTGYGILSWGWENDTALDVVDGAGDFTAEFGNSAGDASDAFNVFQFRGKTASIAYGISYFDTSDDRDEADSGLNGFIGYESDLFNIYAGYETRDEAKYDVMSLSGNATFGLLQIGLNAWINDGDKGDLTGKNLDEKKSTGFYTSAAYQLTDDFTLALGYSATTDEKKGSADVDASYINVSGFYNLNGVDIQFDVKQDIKNGDAGINQEETWVFAAAYWYF